MSIKCFISLTTYNLCFQNVLISATLTQMQKFGVGSALFFLCVLPKKYIISVPFKDLLFHKKNNFLQPLAKQKHSNI